MYHLINWNVLECPSLETPGGEDIVQITSSSKAPKVSHTGCPTKSIANTFYFIILAHLRTNYFETTHLVMKVLKRFCENLSSLTFADIKNNGGIMKN